MFVLSPASYELAADKSTALVAFISRRITFCVPVQFVAVIVALVPGTEDLTVSKAPAEKPIIAQVVQVTVTLAGKVTNSPAKFLPFLVKTLQVKAPVILELADRLMLL